ncbi:MAG TPA: 4Fe-4S binding protein [Chloroflexia bacterium]|nr:4Fe-4S binding protein [Chloroflexia bacterium]
MKQKLPTPPPAPPPGLPMVDPDAAPDVAPVLQVTRQRVVLSLHVDENRCLSCAGCISVCPRMTVPVSRINSLAEGILCRGCGLCVQVCPVEALSQIPIVLAEPPRVPEGQERRRAARATLPPSTETQ